MNYLAHMLMTPVQPLFDPEQTPRRRKRSPAQSLVGKRTAAQQESRYRAVFDHCGGTTTAITIAAKLGIDPHNAARYLRRLEIRGQVRCVGSEPSGGTNPRKLWQWAAGADASTATLNGGQA